MRQRFATKNVQPVFVAIGNSDFNWRGGWVFHDQIVDDAIAAAFLKLLSSRVQVARLHRGLRGGTASLFYCWLPASKCSYQSPSASSFFDHTESTRTGLPEPPQSSR